MEFRSIRQTSHISGVNRNPGADEHDKAFVWDNNISKVKYVSIANLSANSKTANGYVVKGDDSTAADFIWKLDSLKNPAWRKEEYLSTVARQSGGNSLIFTMNSGSSKTVALGALAWLDTVPVSITLPGNTRVLFDDGGTIGGSSSFTFDKTNKILQLVDFAGISVLNNADVSAKSVLQYFGNKNIMIANGAMKTVAWGANLVNNIFIGDGTGSNALTAQNNVRIGHFAGADASTNMQGGVFIGNYAGRLETANNAFYLGNTNYGTIGEFKSESLLYGDFATNWLKINKHLAITEEVRVGTYTGATPLWGMINFVEIGITGVYKCQYYDGGAWVDFATGSNNYLATVTKATADVGTTDAAYRITFTRNGLTDIVLQLGANAFNSDVILSADGSIPLTKLEDMPTSTLIYRKSLGDGPPEVQTLATLAADLGISNPNVYSINLPAASTVAGRIAGAVAPTNFPTGWTLTADGNNLIVTHGLNREIATVSVFSKNLLISRQLFGNAAYSGIYQNYLAVYNNVVIESLATVVTEITIKLVFA